MNSIGSAKMAKRAAVVMALGLPLSFAALDTAVSAPNTCHGEVVTMVGTAGADTIRGTARQDSIVALGGNDVIRGLGSNDEICAGPGADRVLGGAGKDTLDGAGADRRRGTGPAHRRYRQRHRQRWSRCRRLHRRPGPWVRVPLTQTRQATSLPSR
jgi:hypothetical protein